MKSVSRRSGGKQHQVVSPTTAKKAKSYAKRFDEKFDGLVKFNEENGHCNVNRRDNDYAGLGRWVQKQRTKYKKENHGNLTPERIERLEKLKFIWDPFNEKWEHQFNNLEKYKEKNGSCNVPWHYSDDPTLGRWVAKQRRLHKNGKLSFDRSKRLREAGFEWPVVSEDEDSDASGGFDEEAASAFAVGHDVRFLEAETTPANETPSGGSDGNYKKGSSEKPATGDEAAPSEREMPARPRRLERKKNSPCDDSKEGEGRKKSKSRGGSEISLNAEVPADENRPSRIPGSERIGTVFDLAFSCCSDVCYYDGGGCTKCGNNLQTKSKANGSAEETNVNDDARNESSVPGGTVTNTPHSDTILQDSNMASTGTNESNSNECRDSHDNDVSAEIRIGAVVPERMHSVKPTEVGATAYAASLKKLQDMPARTRRQKKNSPSDKSKEGEGRGQSKSREGSSNFPTAPYCRSNHKVGSFPDGLGIARKLTEEEIEDNERGAQEEELAQSPIAKSGRTKQRRKKKEKSKANKNAMTFDEGEPVTQPGSSLPEKSQRSKKKSSKRGAKQSMGTLAQLEHCDDDRRVRNTSSLGQSGLLTGERVTSRSIRRKRRTVYDSHYESDGNGKFRITRRRKTKTIEVEEEVIVGTK